MRVAGAFARGSPPPAFSAPPGRIKKTDKKGYFSSIFLFAKTRGGEIFRRRFPQKFLLDKPARARCHSGRRFRHIMKLKKTAESAAGSRAAPSARGIVEKSNPRPFAGGGSGARGEARLTEKERTVIRWTKISSK